MVVLVDTNVVLDSLQKRVPFSGPAKRIMELCEAHVLKGYIAAHSIPNLSYILRKTPREIRQEWLLTVCNILEIAWFNYEDIIYALNTEAFTDFEDCLQERCAVRAKADYIVTRNPVDFKNSTIPIVSPEELLKMVEADKSDDDANKEEQKDEEDEDDDQVS